MKNVYVEGITLHELMNPSKLGLESYSSKPSVSLFNQAKEIASGFVGTFNSNVFTAVGQRLSAMFTVNTPISGAVNLDPAVRTWLDRNNYIKLDVVQVYRPIGLTSTYLEFISELETAFTYIKDVDNELLAPAESFVMTMLNNPSMLTASSLSRKQTKYTAKEIDKCATDLGKCYDKNEVSDRYSWSEAVERNADYPEAERRIHVLQTAVEALGIEKIRERTERIFQLVEQLTEVIRNNPAHSAMTKNVANKLGAEIAISAQAVEFLAVVVSQIHIMNVAVNDSTKHLKKLSKMS